MPAFRVFQRRAPGLLAVSLPLALPVIVILSRPLPAGEKNGVSPNTVSLPSGPGSIEGLGESFEPMLQTGTAKYAFPIALPAGVAGHAPAIVLAYDGGYGNGPLGYGWKLGPDEVKRQVDRGVPRYTEQSADDDTFLGMGGMELVELRNGYFLSRIEGSFTRYRRVWSDRTTHPEQFYWEAHAKDGTKLEFGLTPSGRVELPARSVTEPERRFRWLLERETDVHGNVIEYRYSDLGAPEDRQKYLVEVRYGAGSPPWAAFHFATFEYQDRDDWFVDCRSSFPVRMARRLVRITVGVQGAAPADTPLCKASDFNQDGQADALIRRYDLLYEGHAHWSLLTQITVTGCDGVNTLPPAAFRYGTEDAELSRERTIAVDPSLLIYSENPPPSADDSKDVELADLNADGLPDLLQTFGGIHWGYLNQGVKPSGPDAPGDACSAGPLRIHWSEPVVPPLTVDMLPQAFEYRLEQPSVHLADMDADGLSDLVVTEGEFVRYYPNIGNLEQRNPGAEIPRAMDGILWGAAREMSIEGDAPPPPFDFGMKGSVRTLDANFDKLMDVVRSSSTGYEIWYNKGGGTYAPDAFACGAVFDGAVLEFSDRRVKVADMNGDRLVDAARIENARVVVCVNLGWGEFAEAVLMPIPGVVLDFHQLDRAELKDLNGDGLSDLVIERAESGELWFWWNLGTGAFSSRRVFRGVQDISLAAKADWADMNGNGTTDLVYSDSRLCDRHRIRVIDIGLIADGNEDPRILKTIDNGLGLQTVIFYRSSSDFYQDAVQAHNPWTVSNPDPVQLVSRVESSTGLDLDGVAGTDVYRSDLSYRDGYYDPVRRQFSGFAFVKRISHGDSPGSGDGVSGSTLVERFAFHTGGPDGIDNDGDSETDEAEEWMGREEEPLKGAQLWMEKASLPDDPMKDGSYAEDSVVFERAVSLNETWQVRDLCTSTGGAMASLLGAGYRSARADYRVVLAVKREEHRYIIEQGSGPPKHLLKTMDLDPFGNPSFEWDQGEVGPGTPTTDDRYTEHRYGRNTAAWIIGLPVRTAVRAGGAAGAFVSDTRNYYDGAPSVGLALGQVGTRGLLSRTQSSISEPSDWTPRGAALPAITENAAAIGDPRQPGASVDVLRNEYDRYGNIVTLLDARSSRREVAYDAAFHTYPVRETISTGQPGGPLAIEVSYHIAHGTVVRSVDFNGNATTYEYDVFGRPTSVTRPLDLPTHPTLTYRYAMANPRPLPGTRPRPGDAPLAVSTPLHYDYDGNGALILTNGAAVPLVSSVRTFARETRGGGTFDAGAFVDGGGKSLASLEEAETAGRWIVKGAATYNLRGQPRQSYQPYEQAGAVYAPPSEAAVPHNDLFYDAAGRTVKTIDPPDANGVRHFSKTDYLPFQVDTSDQEDTLTGGRHAGTPKSVFSDALGRIVRVIERNKLDSDPADPSQVYETNYTWNPQDKLVTITDSRQNVKYMRYDGLGRQIYMNDLDAGRRTYTYDPAGNLTERVDAKGQQIIYVYDAVNRLILRSYLDGSGNPLAGQPDDVFTYDIAPDLIDQGDNAKAMPANTRGALVSVSDSSGASYNSYDERGRVQWTVKMIPDPGTAVKDEMTGVPLLLSGLPVYYKTQFTYDSMDRVTDMVYPDGDHVAYRYNIRTLLQSIRGGDQGKVVIEDTQYMPSGQLKRQVAGNGVATTHTYDQRLRMTDLLVAGAGATQGKQLLHYAYKFDGVSNITSIQDLRPDVPATDARHNSQAFEYDDLYRLTKYQLTDAALTMNRGVLQYRYDRIGNILFNSSPQAGSPGHIDHDEDGKTIVNLGAYTYSGGTSGRVGRNAGAPAGPHAVTGTASGRSYVYDDNGNMLNIDGKTASWDALDHMVKLEAPGLVALYTYDHTGQRVTKAVLRNGRLEYVLYINQHFEVREGEAPIKYVFAVETRVAQVKGTLDPSRQRIQRMRLVKGWNLVSFCVDTGKYTAHDLFGLDPGATGPDPAVLEVIDHEGDNYKKLQPDSTLLVGTPAGVYWVYSSEAQIRTFVGSYAESIPDYVIPRSEIPLVGWPRLEGLYVDETFRGLEQVWAFDATAGQWVVRDLAMPGAADNISGPLNPGVGVWAVKIEGGQEAGELLLKTLAMQQIVFYQTDHLGSTGAATDFCGESLNESAFYPFGAVRNAISAKSWVTRDYKYTGKEADSESELYYYGARYYDPIISVWLTTDPMLIHGIRERGGDTGILSPENLGSYTYARNSPIVSIDPNGEDVIVVVGKHNPGEKPTFPAVASAVIKSLKKGRLADRVIRVNFGQEVKQGEQGTFATVKEARAAVETTGRKVSALIFVGHGGPDNVAAGEDPRYADVPLEELAAQAGIERGGVCVALACNVYAPYNTVFPKYFSEKGIGVVAFGEVIGFSSTGQLEVPYKSGEYFDATAVKLPVVHSPASEKQTLAENVYEAELRVNPPIRFRVGHQLP